MPSLEPALGPGLMGGRGSASVFGRSPAEGVQQDFFGDCSEDGGIRLGSIRYSVISVQTLLGVFGEGGDVNGVVFDFDGLEALEDGTEGGVFFVELEDLALAVEVDESLGDVVFGGSDVFDVEADGFVVAEEGGERERGVEVAGIAGEDAVNHLREIGDDEEIADFGDESGAAIVFEDGSGGDEVIEIVGGEGELGLFLIESGLGEGVEALVEGVFLIGGGFFDGVSGGLGVGEGVDGFVHAEALVDEEDGDADEDEGGAAHDEAADAGIGTGGDVGSGRRGWGIGHAPLCWRGGGRLST